VQAVVGEAVRISICKRAKAATDPLGDSWNDGAADSADTLHTGGSPIIHS